MVDNKIVYGCLERAESLLCGLKHNIRNNSHEKIINEALKNIYSALEEYSVNDVNKLDEA